jgi:hypothetical protein
MEVAYLGMEAIVKHFAGNGRVRHADGAISRSALFLSKNSPLPKGEGCLFTLQSVWGACQALLGRIVLGMRGVDGLGPSFQFTGRCTRSR